MEGGKSRVTGKVANSKAGLPMKWPMEIRQKGRGQSCRLQGELVGTPDLSWHSPVPSLKTERDC